MLSYTSCRQDRVAGKSKYLYIDVSRTVTKEGRRHGRGGTYETSCYGLLVCGVVSRV